MHHFNVFCLTQNLVEGIPFSKHVTTTLPLPLDESKKKVICC